MDITIGELITWLIVGALSGTLVGRLLTRSKAGYGRMTNIGIGLAGALLGGILFEVTGIDMGLSDVSVSLEDLVRAVIGSLLLLVIVWGVKFYRKKKAA